MHMRFAQICGNAPRLKVMNSFHIPRSRRIRGNYRAQLKRELANPKWGDPVPSQPTVTGVVEAILYVADLDRSFRFYQELFGFETEQKAEMIGVLRVPGGQALILFPKKIAEVTEPMKPPAAIDGTIPTHGGDGRLHVAFSIPADQLETWEQRLRSQGVKPEGKVRWKRGGTSLYFRDPDAHLIELITPGLWSFY